MKSIVGSILAWVAWHSGRAGSMLPSKLLDRWNRRELAKFPKGSILYPADNE